MNCTIEPPRLVRLYAVAHCYIVFILGVFANSVALWCIGKCTKTKPALKILMMTIFGSLLMICLFTRVVMAEKELGELASDPNRPPMQVYLGFVLLYSFGAQLELDTIATMAVCRALAVRASTVSELSKCVAIAIVVGLIIYSALTTVFLLGSTRLGYVQDPQTKVAVERVYFFLNVMLPVSITMISYVLMMCEMRRNRLRLAQVQSRRQRVLNNATRGMLAVFTSNLLFSLPHAIYHLIPKPSCMAYIIFHILFSTHFVVDPIVFIYFNQNYRRSVCQALLACWECLTGKCGAKVPQEPSFSSGTTTSSGLQVASKAESRRATEKTKA